MINRPADGFLGSFTGPESAADNLTAAVTMNAKTERRRE
jgi:hypothetical protein